MNNNDAVIEAIRAELGANASALQHLPTDEVKIESFDEKKNERPNTVPYRILFGHMKEGQDKGNTVWILLQFNHPADRSPVHFWNVFDEDGRLLRKISAEEAVRRTDLATPFEFLKTSDDMDEDQLRAVTRYYFIKKGIRTSSSWIVGDVFIKSLAAACVAARDYEEKVTPQLPDVQRAPTASMVPLMNEASSLFVPENSHVKTTSDSSMNTANNKTPGIQAVLRARTTSLSNPHVVASAASSSHERAGTDASRSMPTRTRSMEVPNEKSPNSQSSEKFVSAYRKYNTDRDAIKDEIKAIKREQNEMEVRLAELKDRKHQRKEALQLIGAGRKRLLDSLSGNERVIFELGREHGGEKLKRSKTGTLSEGGSSEDED